MELTVISTFAGCGGSSLGFKWAGFKELLAIEYEDNAADTFKLNFPKIAIMQKDIKDVTGKEILRTCRLKKGELDILDGSPPCQGYSLSGKRRVNDDRNDLFIEYVRLIDELQPKVFDMENVTGMSKGKMKGRFIEIMKTLKELNYDVKCKVMNSKYYGVPQSRERLIFIGVRKDLKRQPIFPDPGKKIITSREALKGCNPDLYHKLKPKYKVVWNGLRPGENMSDFLKSSSHFNDVVILNPNKPAPTLLKTNMGTGFATLCHWNEPRSISIEEAKRLSSFPDNFKFIGSYSDQWARIGNAVMPKFMQAIAECIKDNILLPYYLKKAS